MPSVNLKNNNTSSTQILNNDRQQVNELVPHILIKDKLDKEFNNSKIHALWTDFNSDNLSTKVIATSNCTNGFAAAILQAYSSNQHLFLSPDDVWLIIAQGISQHINYHSEKYRQRIVSHQGQKRVEIHAGSLLEGNNDESDENDENDENEENEENEDSGETCTSWMTFLDKINQVTDVITIKDLLTCNFSTSTKSTKISSELVLLNSVHYNSNYETNSSPKFGIHKITLDGTLDDWLNIQKKINFLRKLSLDLDFWLDRLDPVVGQFISTYKGDIDLNFWNTFSTEVDFGQRDNIMLTGWISAFFPYIKENVPLDVNCIHVYDIPDGRISIPFVNPDDSPSIRIVSGFFGTKQELRKEDNDNNEIIVSPVIGWAIVDL